MFINHQPFLIIISSPSGAGKSTLCHLIIQNDPLIKLSISATTRPQRPKEIHGQNYFFISKSEFDHKQRDSQFLESAQVFDHHYGTPRKPVEEEIKKGNCVLFDIDWQGARQIKEKFSANEVVSIFILPPSMPELERRLRARASDSEEIVQNRMKKARDEISHFNEYDFILVNDDLNNTYQRIRAIIEAKRISSYQKSDIRNFVQQLIGH